jgi:hypothetical protein
MLTENMRFGSLAPERVLDVLHHIRKLGKASVHDGQGNHREALACLKMSVHLRLRKGEVLVVVLDGLRRASSMASLR